MESPDYLKDLLTRLPDRLWGDMLFLHLGHFADGNDDIRVAQRRMNAEILARVALADGQAVLDVGCGIGGTLAALNTSFHDMELVGLNIGADQLAVAENSVEPTHGNRVSWVHGDAVALPFEDARFDRLISIEAMFHFPSRRRFFAEAGRVLKAGGRLAGSDLRIAPGADPDVVALVTEGLGPWPDPFGTEGSLEQLASEAGIDLTVQDVTDAAGSSFVRLMGEAAVANPSGLDNGGDRGTAALGTLVAAGSLSIVYLSGTKS